MSIGILGRGYKISEMSEKKLVFTGFPPNTCKMYSKRSVLLSAICFKTFSHCGNKKAAAVELGIDKTTLWRKLKKLKKVGLLGDV